MNNYVIVGSPFIPGVFKSRELLLDYLRDKRTLIITKNFETRGYWTASIMRSIGINPMTVSTDEDLKLIEHMDKHISYLNFFVSNKDVDKILNKHFDAIIIDEAWALISCVGVCCWITTLKTANPDCQLFIYSATNGNGFVDRVDSRYLPLVYIEEKHLEYELTKGEKPKEDLPPTINIHIYKKDINSLSEIVPVYMRPYPYSSAKIFESVDCDRFTSSILTHERMPDSIRCYTSIPRAIDLLDRAIDILTTAMAFDPIPLYGRRLTIAGQQLEALFDNQSVRRFNELYNCHSGRDSKNIIFCDKGRSDLPQIRTASNFYVKDMFSDGSIGYSMTWFKSNKISTLCIEKDGYLPPDDVLAEAHNIFILDKRRHNKDFISSLCSGITTDTEIVIPCVAKTADESNVVKALSGLDNLMFNVIKHDLPS